MSSPATLRLDRLKLHAVRSLTDGTFTPGPRFNLICGDNGQGKTSLLEAIYLVATTRSFRTSRMREVATHGTKAFSIHAELARGAEPTMLRSVVWESGALRASLDHQPARTLAEYATRAPVVVFHPAELQLSTGAAVLRRRLLDRIALYRTPAILGQSARYAKALRARQELLRSQASQSELAAYEHILAEAGAWISAARIRALEDLKAETVRVFSALTAGEHHLGLKIKSGGSVDTTTALTELEQRRDRDRRAPQATFGPQRDDIEIRVDEHLARESASQGQHRAIALSLKAAETAAIVQITGMMPIQLLDDVSSELDEDRTSALIRMVSQSPHQVFLTTTRPELIRPFADPNLVSLFQIVSGHIKAL